MTDAWKSYAHAPAPGRRICAAAEAPETGAKCFDLDGFPLLLARVGAEWKAYVNACPHQYLPFDHKGDRISSADGKVIRCTSHGAGFCAETGEGVEGFGLGETLDPVPVSLQGDELVIG